MKKINADLIVGASILAALFILVAGVLWLREASVANTMVNYAVIFPEVGTLQLGDPVYVNGVKKGTVQRISLRGTEVLTILNIDRRINITESVRVAVVNVGLLGERGIGVTLSADGAPVRHLVPGVSDTAFIKGHFDTGISEAMGMLGTVLLEVETLVGTVGDVLNATVGDTTFIRQFHGMIEKLDSITVVTDRLLKRNEPILNATFSDLRVVSRDLRAVLDRNTAGIDSIVSGGQELMGKGIQLVEVAESLVVDVQGILRNIEEGHGTLGQLYTDETFYDDLREVMAAVDTLIAEVREDALKLRVRLGFGRRNNRNRPAANTNTNRNTEVPTPTLEHQQ